MRPSLNALEIHGLKTYFFTQKKQIKAVDGIDVDIPKGFLTALVGESGCGKSVTALSIMRLIPDPPGRIVEGDILFEGRNILDLSEGEMNDVRGNKISMIFQDPMTALNPVLTVGDQIAEVLITHRGYSKRDAKCKSMELLDKVGIPSSEENYFRYPHQMSGGMRQRVMIAMAVACEPAIVIADEPTTALDVTVQARILQLLKDLQGQMKTSILLITHDFRIVAEMADVVAVMYAGKIVEMAPVNDIFDAPLHPYTQALMKSIPGVMSFDTEGKRLSTIPGSVPAFFELTSGCGFGNRCPQAMKVCTEEVPPMFYKDGGHEVRCWLYR